MKQKSDEELVELSGMNAPYAELLRRNTEALKSASKSSHWHSVNVFALSVLLLAIAGTEFLLGLVSIEAEPTWFRLGVAAFVVFGIVFVVLREIGRD